MTLYIFERAMYMWQRNIDLRGNFLGHLSILETLWLETFYAETFWLGTFCPMLSFLKTLWPETFWAETFWAGFINARI